MSKAFPVSIERTADGAYRLHWDEADFAGPVRVRVHTDPAQAPAAEPVLASAASGVRIELPAHERHYFHLEPVAGEPLTAAQRDISLQGGTNFRDMGGYRAADGRRVRWGRLFRSGHSAALTDQDREHLEGLGIRTCCDFRRDEERAIEPNGLPESIRIVGLQLMPGSALSFYERISSGDAKPQDMVDFMIAINRDFVRNNTEPFRGMFEQLLAQEDGAFMINCAAGKDRTGFGAAMILAALGVAEQDIVEDYALSMTYFPIQRELERVRRKYVPPGGHFDVDVMMPMMEARGPYIAAALDEIRSMHGSSEAFLNDALGLGERELRLLRERLTA
jgi:protein-tyrosine phosphatase